MSDDAREFSIYWNENAKPVPGTGIERVTGEELVTVMRSNVAEAMANVAAARTNLHRARAEGRVVFDERHRRLRAASVGEGRRRVPDARGDVAMFDWFRAVAELAHWQGYLKWAKTQRVGDLPDRRLPQEHDDLEEAPF